MHVGFTTLERFAARLTPDHEVFLLLQEEAVAGRGMVDLLRLDLLAQAWDRRGAPETVLYWKLKIGTILAPGGEPWPEEYRRCEVAGKSARAAVRQFLGAQPGVGRVEDGALIATPQDLKLLSGRAECLTFDRDAGVFLLKHSEGPLACQVCGRAVRGSLSVAEASVGGVGLIRITGTPDRDWIACDACNLTVCHSCCRRPESGYCDGCLEQYKIPESAGADSGQ
jgi:hypothetical protein